MSRASNAPAATDPTPTPTPASEQRTLASFRNVLQLVVARRDPGVEAAHAEAYEQYGDDPDLELAAFAAGSHPLQRGRTPAQIEETKRMAAESFARRPAKISAA